MGRLPWEKINYSWRVPGSSVAGVRAYWYLRWTQHRSDRIAVHKWVMELDLVAFSGVDGIFVKIIAVALNMKVHKDFHEKGPNLSVGCRFNLTAEFYG